MADIEFMYKGKKIVIREAHPDAVVSVDGREFVCHHHHEEADQGLPMWMCEETYFASPDIRELARHFADYGYMFDDPGRIVVNEAGEVVRKGAKAPAKKAAAGRSRTGSASRGGHGSHGRGGGN